MLSGLFIAQRAPDFTLALCLGGQEPGLAWFLTEDGDLRRLDWRAFHEDYHVVGYYDALGSYVFSTPQRVRAEWSSGVFSAGFAAATRAQWDLTPG